MSRDTGELLECAEAYADKAVVLVKSANGGYIEYLRADLVLPLLNHGVAVVCRELLIDAKLKLLAKRQKVSVK